MMSNRRRLLALALCNGWVLLPMSLSGCTTSAVRLQSPETEEIAEVESKIRLVGGYTTPMGLRGVKVEAIGLVTGLDGTGSDPPPSSRRSMLIDDMQAREVENPNTVLASPNTSLVIVSALIPPGIQKGERFDVEVRAPRKSTTTSLRGGRLLASRLQEIAVMGNRVHKGHERAYAEGLVLVDSYLKGDDDPVNEVRGRILGGGVALASRELRLVIRSDQHSVRLSQLIGVAVNGRFHGYHRGTKKGMATPRTDKYVDLHLHTRYQENVSRYVRVIQSIPLRISAAEQIVYLRMVERQLQDPAMAESAALRLEAIGRDAVEILAKGLEVNDPVVQFYVAEALAYLDDSRAAETLAAAAERPAQRRRALAALAAMDQVAAYDQLVELLHVPSARTRYGAFRALRSRNPNDPLISRLDMEGEFHYRTVATTADSMVHVSWREIPEVVVFGDDVQLKMPLVVFAGSRVMVDGRHGDVIKVSLFRANDADENGHCSPRLSEVLGTIVRLGGTYPEVVEFLQNAKSADYLDARLVVDSIPHQSRLHHRKAERNSEVKTNRNSWDSSGKHATVSNGPDSLPAQNTSVGQSKTVARKSGRMNSRPVEAD